MTSLDTLRKSYHAQILRLSSGQRLTKNTSVEFVVAVRATAIGVIPRGKAYKRLVANEMQYPYRNQPK